MLYYKTCPYCGAHLDPGEQCDCKKAKEEKPTITDFIPHGKENAITRAELCSITNLQDRPIRELIETARRNGAIILNDQDGKGYYISDNLSDIKRQYHQNNSRAMSILVQQKFLRRKLKAAGIDVKKVAATSGKATTTRENNIFNSISQLEANVNV